MFDFLKRKQPAKALESGTTPVSVSPHSSTHSSQHSSIQRELIRVVLKDTLRLHGIPLDWLACEVFNIIRSSGKDQLHIQLMVMKWNDKLLRFAPALQQQLLLGLDRFDPSTDHSKYIFSWRFSPACGNPLTRMPDPQFWVPIDFPPTQTQPGPGPDKSHSQHLPNAALLEPSLFEDVNQTSFEQTSTFPSTDVAPLR